MSKKTGILRRILQYWPIIIGAPSFAGIVIKALAGDIRHGAVKPMPIAVSDFRGNLDDSKFVLGNLPDSIQLNETDRLTLCTSLSEAIKTSHTDSISIGTWVLVTEENTKADSLVIRVSSAGNQILCYKFVSEHSIIYDTLSTDKKSIKFCLPPLPTKTQIALIMVHAGTTEAKYDTDIIDGPEKDDLILLSSRGSWESKLLLWSLVLIFGVSCSAFYYRWTSSRKEKIELIKWYKGLKK